MARPNYSPSGLGMAASAISNALGNYFQGLLALQEKQPAMEKEALSMAGTKAMAPLQLQQLRASTGLEQLKTKTMQDALRRASLMRATLSALPGVKTPQDLVATIQAISQYLDPKEASGLLKDLSVMMKPRTLNLQEGLQENLGPQGYKDYTESILKGVKARTKAYEAFAAGKSEAQAAGGYTRQQVTTALTNLQKEAENIAKTYEQELMGKNKDLGNLGSNPGYTRTWLRQMALAKLIQQSGLAQPMQFYHIPIQKPGQLPDVFATQPGLFTRFWNWMMEKAGGEQFKIAPPGPSPAEKELQELQGMDTGSPELGGESSEGTVTSEESTNPDPAGIFPYLPSK